MPPARVLYYVVVLGVRCAATVLCESIRLFVSVRLRLFVCTCARGQAGESAIYAVDT